MEQYRDAIKAYNSAWEITQSRELVVKRFNALREVDAKEDAYELIQPWLNEHPDDGYVHTILAAAYEADGQDQKAILHYEKVLEKEPDNITVLNNLAWVYNKQNDDRAIDLAERAYRQNPESPAILDTYGWVLLQQGETEKALGILQQAAKALPDVAEVQYHKAVAVYRSGDKAAALSELKALLDSGVAFEGREDARAIVESN